MMQGTRIGLDIAKNVFQVHGVEEHGKVVVRKQSDTPQYRDSFKGG